MKTSKIIKDKILLVTILRSYTYLSIPLNIGAGRDKE